VEARELHAVGESKKRNKVIRCNLPGKKDANAKFGGASNREKGVVKNVLLSGGKIDALHYKYGSGRFCLGED